MTKIAERRLMPKNPSNGQIAVWSAAQNKWVAQDQTSGGIDTSGDYTIDGYWTFRNPIKIGIPIGVIKTPGASEGHILYAGEDQMEYRVFDNDILHAWDYSGFTQNRVHTLPDASGTFALTSNLTGMLKLPQALDATLRAVRDYAGNISPLQLSTTGIAVIASDQYPIYLETSSVNGAYLTLSSNNGNSNMTAGQVAAALELTGRRNGALSTLSRFRVVYRGDGITRTSETVLAVANASGNMSDFLVAGGGSSSFVQIPAAGRAFLVGGTQFTATTYTGPSQASISYNTVIHGDTNHGITASARLHVRGDGTNPIARFENNSGTQFFKVNQSTYATVTVGDDSGANYFTLGLDSAGNGSITGNYGSGKTIKIGNGANYAQYRGAQFDPAGGIYNYIGPANFTAAFTYKGFVIDTSIACATGASSFHVSSILYTINNSGAQSGTATGIFLNATETALNGMTHYLMDLQVGGTSQFRIANNGYLYTGNKTLGLGRQQSISNSTIGVALGYKVQVDGDNNIAIGGIYADFPGYETKAYGSGNIAIGIGAQTGIFSSVSNSIAIGFRATATANSSVAIGNYANAPYANTYVISSDYKVGVGAENPLAKLHIKRNVESTLLLVTDNGDGTLFKVDQWGNTLVGNLLQFGGTTSSYPGLRRNGTILELVTADSNAFVDFRASTICGAKLCMNSGTGKLISPSDGVITLYDNAETGFDILQFGGTNNLRPAIKRDGTGLKVMLADSSHLTSLMASSLTTDNLVSGALATAKAVKFGGQTSQSEIAGFDKQFAIEVDGNVMYVAAKSTQLS